VPAAVLVEQAVLAVLVVQEEQALKEILEVKAVLVAAVELAVLAVLVVPEVLAAAVAAVELAVLVVQVVKGHKETLEVQVPLVIRVGMIMNN
jgi:hypothetical protein